MKLRQPKGVPLLVTELRRLLFIAASFRDATAMHSWHQLFSVPRQPSPVRRQRLASYSTSRAVPRAFKRLNQASRNELERQQYRNRSQRVL